MDTRHLAVEAGRLLATCHVAYSLAIEGNLTSAPIFPHRVSLEPPYRVYDPAQTFAPLGERLAEAASPQSWVTRRLILPVTEEADSRRIETFVAGLSGCQAVCLEFIAGHDDASFFLSASPDDSDFVAGAWLAQSPHSALVESSDPWHGFNREHLVLYDLYSPAPYQARLQTVMPWAHLLHLTLDTGSIVFLQLIFAPVRHAWQRNIAGMLTAERSLGQRSPHGSPTAAKNLDEPLFAAVLRVGATMPSLAGSLEAFTGTFSADGKPFAYRTIEDYLRVLSRQDVVGMLRERTTYTIGQLVSAGELAPLVQPPPRGIPGNGRLSFFEELPVPERLRSPGLFLGANTSRGVAIPRDSRWLVGAGTKRARKKHGAHPLVSLPRALRLRRGIA